MIASIGTVMGNILDDKPKSSNKALARRILQFLASQGKADIYIADLTIASFLKADLMAVQAEIVILAENGLLNVREATIPCYGACLTDEGLAKGRKLNAPHRTKTIHKSRTATTRKN